MTSGLGRVVVAELAAHGAEVVLAGRDPARLDEVAAQVRAAGSAGSAPVHQVACDLADLASVRAAAVQSARLGPLDILVNNAGVMAPPHRRTVDGFELQLGTNHLGHFAITGLLLNSLIASGAARVVTVSSLMARSALHAPLHDPVLDTGRYWKWQAYAQSKLANLLFAFELDRRARAAGLRVTSVAAHPGYSSTSLVRNGVNLGRRRLDGSILEAVTPLVGQSAARGALPLLRAATDPALPGSSYVGPSGPFGLRGFPDVVPAPPAAYDEDSARELWEISEAATGVRYP